MLSTKKWSFAPLFYITLIYIFFFLLKSPILANETIFNALELCYKKVIPSLFPFLVLNELMTLSNLCQILGKKIGKPISLLFGISDVSAISFISGSLFGFPLGTKNACSLHKNNLISKEEAERLICFCSNTGPSFVIGFLGIILQNKPIAITIYFCQILSATIIGLFLRKNNTANKKQAQKANNFNLSIIPSSITSSIIPMLNICSFVCFFSIISVSIENLLIHLTRNEFINIFITGFLEITNGISKCETINIYTVKILLCSFFIGWSGVSVILQSISIMSEYKIKCRKFVVCKLFQGLLCSLLSVLICKIFNMY